MSRPGRTLVDDEARRRAGGDLDASFCVEAGAGTGKTTLLVDRYLSIVRSGRAGCSGILAITFTEKAAGEMKERVRRKINSLATDPRTGDPERGHLLAAREELDAAPVSTIHAFASSLLREYPLEARVDPAFRQLDAVDGPIFLEKCWDEFLADLSTPYDDLLRRCLAAGMTVGKIFEITAAVYRSRGGRFVRGIFPAGGKKTVESKQAGEGRSRIHAGGDRAPDSYTAAYRDHLIGAARELAALVEASCTDPSDRGAVEIDRFLSAMRVLEDLDGEELEEYLLSLEIPARRGNRKNWNPPEACAAQKEIAASIAEAAGQFRITFTTGLRDLLTRWIDGFLLYVEERKRQEGVLDFDDLLIEARRLLENEGVLDSLRRRFRFVLVDEFQDTDPLQAEIIFLLSAGEDLAGPDGGKLFIVGDPKQSIYRFRGADVEIYEEFKEMMSATDSLLTIRQNFRSVPGIVDWVNRAFAGIILRSEEGKYQPEYEPIDPFRDGSPEAVTLLEPEREGGGAEEIRAEEGHAAARLIAHIIDEGREVKDPVTGTMRPVRFGDIALIYRGTTGIEHYEDPLRDEGIPYIVEGGRVYYTRQEVRDLSHALWSLEDPHDHLSLVAALRSPLFGFSDEEIFLFTRSGGSLDYLSLELAGGEDPEGIIAALALMASLHLDRNRRGAGGTLRDLIAATSFLEKLKLERHGDQRVANVRKAVNLAREFDEKGFTFRGFARWFRRQDLLGAAEGESPLSAGEDDAVRLITIHTAKGLQFPIVFMVNLVQGKRSGASVLVEGGGRIAFRLKKGSFSGDPDWETVDFEEASRRDGVREEAEAARLLYVAATRAGDHLVIPRSPRGNNYFSMLEPYLDNGGIRVVRACDLPPLKGGERRFTLPRRPGRRRLAEIERARKEWIAGRERIIRGGSRGPAVVTPSGVETFSPVETPAGARNDGGALSFGSCFHRIMEMVPLAGEGGIEGAVSAAAAEFGLIGRKDELAEIVSRVLDTGLVRDLASSGRIFREVSFSVPLEPAGPGGQEARGRIVDFLEGRIDLLCEKNGCWTAVDYKTDDIPVHLVDERFAAYRAQGMLYAAGLSKLGIVPAGGVVFLFARNGEIRRLDVTPDLLEESHYIIRLALSSIRDGRG